MLMRTVTHHGLLDLRNRLALDAALGLVSSIGDRRFAQIGLCQINRLTHVGWWTVYRLHDGAMPDWHLGGSQISNEVIAQAWACYRADLWRQDQTFSRVREQTDSGGAMLMHLHAREVSGSHRARIYSAFGLTERVSLVRRQHDGSTLCVNLYRGLDMPGFMEEELDDLCGIGELTLRAVETHLRCAGAAEAGGAFPLEGLPRREREVCERLLRGLTYDGIGADLGLSANTVKTYRDRAFERLGIHHRSELYALMLEFRPRANSQDILQDGPQAIAQLAQAGKAGKAGKAGTAGKAGKAGKAGSSSALRLSPAQVTTSDTLAQ